ncbi:autotransporter domain-containing protein [Devosia sediminis]|uniref:Autotransporter domain-containing protein n=1 Tax=Devosia sediminis TaxID=2798801 RepID=A0A934IMJ8_9HYPH|nr:autotransporter domain-containing protein [Devosia sediminis]MBJ3783504.1 autotransporter domain-containing protein [Devosia sediminis]
MTFLRTLSVAALATTALSAPVWAAGSIFTPGEIVPGYYWLGAEGVSGNGQYVTGRGYDGSHHVSFLLGPDGVVVPITDPGGWAVLTTDVSNTGAVVGQMTSILTDSFRWTEAGGYENLGRLEMLNGGSSFANAISNDGSRIVGHSFKPSNGFYEAYVFVDGATTGVFGNEQMYGLGTLAGGFETTGADISGNGLWATGTGSISSGDARAVRWSLADIETAWTTIEDLGTLGGFYSVGQGVSNDGRVVVGNSGNAAGHDRAFRWVEGATGGVGGNVQMYDLGTLGGDHSYATAVSADGSVVVGGADDAGNHTTAYRWSTATGMVSVADWLTANGVAVNSTIDNAMGVSDDGNVIVGQHTVGGIGRSYIARVVPDPVPPPGQEPGGQPGGGSGLMDVAEYTHTLLANARAAQMGVDLTWMPLNGAHHRPLMTQDRMEDEACLWSVSDLAYKANTDSGIALSEVGACGALGNGVVAGLGVGASTSWQGLSMGGTAQLSGAYVMGEVDWNPDGTPLLLSLTGVVGGWQASINRAYSNGANTDMSQGSTGVTAGVIRARIDWLDAAQFGNVSINPWISGALGRTDMGGYTESGGAFPARFDGQSQVQGEVRLGVTAEAELSPQTTLSGTLEVAHRSGGAPGASGQVLGLFDFSQGGGSHGATWARAGLDLDHAISEDLSLSGSVHVASQGQDATISGSLGLRATF